MDEKYCFLCRDSEDILYKLCDCNDSLMCVECYNNESTSKMNKCGICRKNYEFQYSRDYYKFLYILLSYISKYGIIIGFELFPPLYLYVQSEYSTLNNVLLCFTLFFILFGTTILYKLFNNYLYYNDNESYIRFLKLFIPLKIIYIMVLFFIILFIYSKDQLLIYNYFILGFMYILPIFFFSIIMIGFYIKKCSNDINESSLTRQIKIKSIIQNNMGVLQSAINYV